MTTQTAIAPSIYRGMVYSIAKSALLTVWPDYERSAEYADSYDVFNGWLKAWHKTNHDEVMRRAKANESMRDLLKDNALRGAITATLMAVLYDYTADHSPNPTMTELRRWIDEQYEAEMALKGV